MSPWAQKWGWTQVLKIIILHFSPAVLPGCPLGFTTLQSHPQMCQDILHGPHSLKLLCFCPSWCLTWDAPVPVVYLTVIKIQLKCSLLCDTIPELSRKNWPCFHCVSNPVPSPRTYPLYSVYIHLTASIIYLSIGLSPLLSYELVEGKDPHSSLYLKHSAWYRVVDGHIDEGINIQMDSVMSWSAPSSPPKKKKKHQLI